MENLKTEFRQSDIKGYYSLFVNDVKTNIWYSKNPAFYNLNTEGKARREKRMIDNNEIFPVNGDYLNFDVCSTFYANYQDAKEIDFQPDFFNAISHLSGSDYSTQEARDKEMEKIRTNIAVWTQWTKAICRKTGKVSENVGVYFGNNGYSIYFY